MIGLGRCRSLPWTALFGLLCAAPLPAQDHQPAPQADMTVPSDGNGLMTLHAYSNLIQMPALVLSPGFLSLPPIKPDRFTLSIDGGPWYRPTHVRPEGADPISLMIVLDFPGSAAELIPKIAETIDRATPQALTAHDHVSLFVMQCKLLDEMRDMPVDPGMLKQKMTEAVDAWTEHSRRKHPPCEEKLHLWDTLAIATLRLGQLPGRRVIIAVTDGVDRGSKNSVDTVTVAMQMRAVATFAIRPDELGTLANGGRGGGRPGMAFQASSQVTTEDPLDRLSQMSGGFALPANRWNAGKQFAHIPELLRGRYILEFPRPSNTSAGTHVIEVHVEKSADFIRVSGISVPLPDPRIAADPTTLPNDPTLTPQVGKTRKPPQ